MMRTKKGDQNQLIERLIEKIDSGQDSFHGYEQEKEILENVITKAFKLGDSGSVIIFGPRGSGKTYLLEATLASLKITESSRRHYIIRLDGQIHNTDALALSVIANVLDIELSNASQIGAALQEKISSIKSKKPFLFILNEIDVFCRRQQTLLYTLFDAIHNVDGLCLIGLSSKNDCTDYVEKRVRSRILYKSIVLSSPFRTSKEYYDYIKEYLEGAIEPTILKPLVDRQYQKSKLPGEIKKFLLDLLLNYDHLKVNKCNHTIEDRKIERLKSLTFLELAVVCLVARRIQQTNKPIFRPIEILPLLNDIPSQITSSKNLFLYVVARLIDYGLVMINTNHRSSSFISDWSSLSLNVEMDQIKTVLRLKKSVLPTNFHKVLETSA